MERHEGVLKWSLFIFRYSKYSSSDRKCEKQFNEYMKDRMNTARAALKELLAETKKITDKSYQMAKEKVSHYKNGKFSFALRLI